MMSARSVAARRLQKLTEAMQGAGLDAVVLYGNAWQNDYLRYAADFGILEGEGIAVVRRDGEVTLYLDDASEAERAAVECPSVDAVAVGDVVQEADKAITRFGNRQIAAGPRRHLPYGLSKHWKNGGNGGMTDATAMLDKLLMLKAEEEVDAIRRAAHLADEGYAVFRQAAEVGKADYALIAESEAFFRANNVDDNFMIIGVGGPEVRGMTPPVGKLLKKGDMVTTELTPCIDGYYVQICRTLVVGEPSEAQRKAFGVYHEAMVAGIDAVKPGATAADIAKAENDVFRRHGLGDYVTSEYTRVRGHGLGLFPDSKPHILEDVTTPIVENMALIVHPNTYHPEVGYIVLGDSIIVGAQGAEVLTTTPRELFGTGADGGTS